VRHRLLKLAVVVSTAPGLEALQSRILSLNTHDADYDILFCSALVLVCLSVSVSISRAPLIDDRDQSICQTGSPIRPMCTFISSTSNKHSGSKQPVCVEQRSPLDGGPRHTKSRNGNGITCRINRSLPCARVLKHLCNAGGGSSAYHRMLDHGRSPAARVRVMTKFVVHCSASTYCCACMPCTQAADCINSGSCELSLRSYKTPYSPALHALHMCMHCTLPRTAVLRRPA